MAHPCGSALLGRCPRRQPTRPPPACLPKLRRQQRRWVCLCRWRRPPVPADCLQGRAVSGAAAAASWAAPERAAARHVGAAPPPPPAPQHPAAPAAAAPQPAPPAGDAAGAGSRPLPARRHAVGSGAAGPLPAWTLPRHRPSAATAAAACLPLLGAASPAPGPSQRHFAPPPSTQPQLPAGIKAGRKGPPAAGGVQAALCRSRQTASLGRSERQRGCTTGAAQECNTSGSSY
jgi:hypothetical protein